MKVTIFRLRLSHLWNNEYCMFVSQIVAIFMKYQPDALHLKKAFERLTAFMPDLANIKAQELGNAISNQLADLNTERKTLIKGIIEQVKTFGRLSLSVGPQLEVLNRFLDKHGRDIGESNYNENTDKFNKLLADYDASADVKAAITALNLTILIEHLRDINTQFATLYLQRTEENSSVESVDARDIRAETDKALTSFFDTFEIFSAEYDTLDYQTPANELNNLISNYKTQLKARTTRRNTGKEVHTEAPITQQV
jgi:hypothetical protein